MLKGYPVVDNQRAYAGFVQVILPWFIFCRVIVDFRFSA